MSVVENQAQDDLVRDKMFTLGAPTFGHEVPVLDVEEALVEGVTLSRRDGTLSSVLPVVLYKQRDRVNVAKLVQCAKAAGECRALGFYLDLTTALSEDSRFSTWAVALQDKRATAVEYLYNDDASSDLSRLVAEMHTPQAARRWNLRANMGYDAFESMFQRHANG